MKSKHKSVSHAFPIYKCPILIPSFKNLIELEHCRPEVYTHNFYCVTAYQHWLVFIVHDWENKSLSLNLWESLCQSKRHAQYFKFNRFKFFKSLTHGLYSVFVCKEWSDSPALLLAVVIISASKSEHIYFDRVLASRYRTDFFLRLQTLSPKISQLDRYPFTKTIITQ